MWVMLVVTSTSRTAIIVFFFLCWLCRFLPFRLFLEFLLSWDFSCLKLSAALRKPKEALLRYHSSFPWSILIDFRSYFFLFLLFLFMFSSYFSPTVQFNNSIVFIVCCKVCCHFCINTIYPISYFSERRSFKCISDLNYSTLSSFLISISSFASFSIIRGRNFLGIWGGFFSNSFL